MVRRQTSIMRFIRWQTNLTIPLETARGPFSFGRAALRQWYTVDLRQPQVPLGAFGDVAYTLPLCLFLLVTALHSCAFLLLPVAFNFPYDECSSETIQLSEYQARCGQH